MPEALPFVAEALPAIGEIFGGAEAVGGAAELAGTMGGTAMSGAGAGLIPSMAGLGGLGGVMGTVGNFLGGSAGLGDMLGSVGGFLGSPGMGGLMNMMGGLYGFNQSQKLADQFNPKGITDSGMQAVERSMSAQGYQGSGNMATALMKYGMDSQTPSSAQIAGQIAALQGKMGGLGLLTSGLPKLSGWMGG